MPDANDSFSNHAPPHPIHLREDMKVGRLVEALERLPFNSREEGRLVVDRGVRDFLLRVITKPKTRPTLSWLLVQQVTAEHFKLTRGQMLGRSRMTSCATARQVAMTLCIEMVPTASLPQVGRWFGRGHTTVLHARHRTRERLAAEPDFAKTVEDIRRAIVKAAHAAPKN